MKPRFAPDKNHHELKEVVRQAAENPLIKLSMELRKCIELQKFPKISNILDRHPDVNMTKDINEFFVTYGNDKTPIDFRVIGSYTNNMVNGYNKTIRSALKPNSEFLERGDKIILQQPNIQKGRDFDTIVHSNGENVELLDVLKKTKKINGVDIKYVRCVDTKSKHLDIVKPESEQDLHQVLETISGKAKKATGETKRDLWKEFFAIKGEFIEIKYIYSCSIHKLQGSSFQSVYLDVRDIMEMQGQSKEKDDQLFRLLYVGVTRSSDKLLLLRN